MDIMTSTATATTQLNGVSSTTSRKKDNGNDPKDNLWYVLVEKLDKINFN